MEERKKISKIILDTNFFVDIFRFKITLADVEEVVGTRCEFWIVGESVSELERMGVNEAKVALRLAKDPEQAKEVLGKPVRTLETGKRAATADETITAVVEQGKNFIVATNDAKLRKKIKALGAKVIYLRARKHLEIH